MAKSRLTLLLFVWLVICCLTDRMLSVEGIADNNNNNNQRSNSTVNSSSDDVLNDLENAEENDTPIVGILSQEVSPNIKQTIPNRNYTSYIASSYVKFVESAGGRVVPIFIGKSREYYAELMSKINGVLLPGGAAYFNESNGYADAGRYIYEIAMELNDNGVYFPIWGTCLGFELLVHLSANSTELRIECSSEAQALPLRFQPSYTTSRLFKSIDYKIKNILRDEPVTANFHMYCFTLENFKKMSLDKQWNVLSVNEDWKNVEFISSIEHTKYPFYGVQFHPEKNMFEFVRNRNISHTMHAISVSQAFANFFVHETRLNKQHFSKLSEERAALIYNYMPTYTAPLGSSFEQKYLFEDEDQQNPISNANSMATSLLPISISVGLTAHFILHYH